MSTDRLLWFENALLPTGWAESVLVGVRDGTITAVTPGAPPPSAAERIAGVAIPGMPNLHSHTFQRGMAGLAERRGSEHDSFWTWREIMYRFLERLTPEDVEALAAFAMVEMLERGFTSLAEFHYLHHDPAGAAYGDIEELSVRILAAGSETGIGLTLLPTLYQYSGFGDAPPRPEQRRFINDPQAFMRLLTRVSAAIAPAGNVQLGLAFHSLRAVSGAAIEEVMGANHGGPIHIHAAEQTAEVDACVAWSGQRPVAWLLDHVPLGPRWCLVHATHMDADETARLAASKAVAGLCPITEANLGDGVFPGLSFTAAGGGLGIGTDSNVEISAPTELKSLEYGQRLQHRARNVLGDRERSTGRALYERALAGGAQACARPIGGLAAGLRLDAVVLDRSHPDLACVSGDRWLDSYVFVAGHTAIDRVLVGGNTLVSRGRHHRREQIEARYLQALQRILA